MVMTSSIRSSDAELAARCGPIELLVVDVDGVLTDGVIAIDDHGVETKHFHVRDGSAISLWRKAGKRAAILSGRSAPSVEIRAAELGISPVIQGAANKGGPFRELIETLGLEPRPPFPLGHTLEQGDWSLLDAVRGRPRMWRDDRPA